MFTVHVADAAVPKASGQNVETASAPEDEYGAKDYRALVSLKPDHDSRALWVVSGTGFSFSLMVHKNSSDLCVVPNLVKPTFQNRGMKHECHMLYNIYLVSPLLTNLKFRTS